MIVGSLSEHLAAIGRGEKSVPVTAAKRHHYVPQFLLANFTTPSPEGGPKLRMLDMTTGSIVDVTTRGAGWERNLYAVHVEGQRDAQVEGFLSLIEQHAAESLKRFLADPLALSDGDRVNLSIYLALQETRTPAALAESRETLRHMGTMFAALSLANVTGRRHRVREAQEALLTGRINVEPTDGMTLSSMLTALLEVAEVICALPWVVLRATDGEFVLSDRPLTRRDPTPPHPFSAGAWVSSPLVYTTIALDPTHCLRISPSGSAPIVLRDTCRQVNSTNLRTYGWGTRYAFARSAAVLEELHSEARANPGSVPKPIPKRIVLTEDLETADPTQAEINRARGWGPLLAYRTETGSRPLSYQVIDSVADARAAMGPRPVARPRKGD